jgi:hypothetical protein
MTPGAERRDRATRLAAVILGTVVLTLFLVASVMLLAGCGGDPCAGHGGTRYWSGSWSYCNDGTVQPG